LNCPSSNENFLSDLLLHKKFLSSKLYNIRKFIIFCIYPVYVRLYIYIYIKFPVKVRISIYQYQYLVRINLIYNLNKIWSDWRWTDSTGILLLKRCLKTMFRSRNKFLNGGVSVVNNCSLTVAWLSYVANLSKISCSDCPSKGSFSLSLRNVSFSTQFSILQYCVFEEFISKRYYRNGILFDRLMMKNRKVALIYDLVFQRHIAKVSLTDSSISHWYSDRTLQTDRLADKWLIQKEISWTRFTMRRDVRIRGNDVSFNFVCPYKYQCHRDNNMKTDEDILEILWSCWLQKADLRKAHQNSHSIS